LEEDAKLLQSFLQVGKKWAEIAKRVGQRTENSVKNRWNSLMKKYKNEFGYDNVSDVGEDNDKEIHWQKKIAQLALESFGRERGNLPLLQTASMGSNRTQTTEMSNGPLARQTMQTEQNGQVKEVIKQEPLMGLMDQSTITQHQQQLHAVLAQMNNGFNPNFGNQNLFLNQINQLGMSPLGRTQFQGQFGSVGGTPQNQVQQSPNIDGFMPNWQNLPGVSGMSPMNQSIGGYSPMNFTGFVGFQGYPSFQNVSNVQQIFQGQTPLSGTTPTNSNDFQMLNNNNSMMKNQTNPPHNQNRPLGGQLGIIKESVREDKSDKASRAESLIDTQVGTGSELLLRERPFDDFPEGTIENHNLQFAVVDLTKNEVFYITNVTRDNFASSVVTMRARDNNPWSVFQPTSLDLMSPQQNNQFTNSLMSLSNLNNNNINSLSQDVANLIITPKNPNRKDEPGGSPSLANLVQFGRFSQESGDLFPSKEIDQNGDYRRQGRQEDGKGGYKQNMYIKEPDNDLMSMESLKNIGDSITGL